MSANITQELTDLILSANAGNAAFVVTTDTAPALFIGSDKKIGINTIAPHSDLEINSTAGPCVKLVYNSSASNYTKMDMDAFGNLSIIPNNTSSTTRVLSIVDIYDHNGSTTGLNLNGILVRSSPTEMNTLAGTIPGIIKSGKALVVNSDKNISGLTAVSANRLSGTVQTSYQPYITKVGVLQSLNIRGVFSAPQYGGTMLTSAQPLVTRVGTLSALTVNGTVKASQLTGTFLTGAQPNITSIGALSTLTLAGITITTETTKLSGSIPGAAIESKVMVINNGSSISGIATLNATTLVGVLQTPQQPLVTSLELLDH